MKVKERLQIPPQDMPEQDAKERIRNVREVPLGYTVLQAVEEAKRCLQCKKPFCVSGCPVGIDIPGFIQHIEDEDFAGAIAVLKRSNLLPALSAATGDTELADAVQVEAIHATLDECVNLFGVYGSAPPVDASQFAIVRVQAKVREEGLKPAMYEMGEPAGDGHRGFVYRDRDIEGMGFAASRRYRDRAGVAARRGISRDPNRPEKRLQLPRGDNIEGLLQSQDGIGVPAKICEVFEPIHRAFGQVHVAHHFQGELARVDNGPLGAL